MLAVFHLFFSAFHSNVIIVIIENISTYIKDCCHEVEEMPTIFFIVLALSLRVLHRSDCFGGNSPVRSNLVKDLMW